MLCIEYNNNLWLFFNNRHLFPDLDDGGLELDLEPADDDLEVIEFHVQGDGDGEQGIISHSI